ncbi:hypothetical protein P879_01199 [Paragonimus westermani]|uniref:CID domain-containing protein n=1 Tax=Paragonimus westermani TaxID=34504 RepID=A0A8T0DU99_9TREM|nr:hypothetical protein P879_01199 [Paragonimus westermani]
MEHVAAFTVELNSLKETQLPVSRKKMASITRAALKALKFYKHIVQCVEKFIIRCPPELKIPGLYVIDAIVRQSQSCYHEKDVYGPRFMRNLVNIFLSLIQCEEKDKPMIMRVLYLWQRSSVFPSQVIQSLQNVVNDPSNISVVKQANMIVTAAMSQDFEIKKCSNELNSCPADLTQDTAFMASELGAEKGPLISQPKPATTAETQLIQLQIMQQRIAEQSALLNQAKMIDPEVRSQLRTLMAQLNQRREEAVAQLAEGKTEEELR